MRGEDDYLEHVIERPAQPQGMPLQREQRAVDGGAARANVGGLLPEDWAVIFQQNRHLLSSVLPWLCPTLEEIYEGQRWMAMATEKFILGHLCLYGLHKEVLVRITQPALGEQAARVVEELIRLIDCQWSEEARVLLQPYIAGRNDSPAASHSPSTSRTQTPDPQLASSGSSTGSTAPEAPTSAPAEQEHTQEEPGQGTETAPSAQRCDGGTSAPSPGSSCSLGGTRRPGKRRASGTQDCPQPRKRPPRRRH